MDGNDDDDDGRKKMKKTTMTKKKTRRTLAAILLAVNAQDGNPDQGRRMFKCSFPNCFYASFWKENVGRHEKIHDKVEAAASGGDAHGISRDFPCGNCPRIYKSRVSLLDHVQTIHEGQDRPLKCGSCSEFKTENFAEFKLHIFQHFNTIQKKKEPKKILKKKVQQRQINSKIEMPKQVEQDQKPIKCPMDQCNFRTKFRTSLHRHQKSCPHQQQPQKPTKLLRSSSVRRMPEPCVTERAQEDDNSEKNRGKIQHKCPLCDRKFQWRHHMLLHMRIHRRPAQVIKTETPKSASCDSDGAADDASADESKGANKSKKLLLKCAFPACEYKSKLACNMHRHVLRYHEAAQKIQNPSQAPADAAQAPEEKEPLRLANGTFKCPICRYTSRVRSNVAYHVAVHSDLKPFVCKTAGCDYRTRWLQNLKKHEQGCKRTWRSGGWKNRTQRQKVLDSSVGPIKLEQPLGNAPEDGANCSPEVGVTKLMVKIDPELFTRTAPQACSEVAPEIPPEEDYLPELVVPTAPEGPPEVPHHSFSKGPPELVPPKIDPELVAKNIPQLVPKSRIIKRINKSTTWSRKRTSIPPEEDPAAKTPSQIPLGIITDTGDGYFYCSLCAYKSRWKTNVGSHMMVHSKEKPHGCPFPGCTYRSKWSQCVRQHSRIVHKLNLPPMKLNVGLSLHSEPVQKLLKSAKLAKIKVKQDQNQVPQEECLFCGYLARLAKCLTKHMRKCPNCYGRLAAADPHDDGNNESLENSGDDNYGAEEEEEEGKLVPKFEQSYAFIL